MAYTLFRPAYSKAWHYRFQIAGVRVQRSTRERLKWRAEKVAEKAYDEAVTLANGLEPVLTLRELVQAWLAVHARTVSAAHLRSVETFGRLHLYDLGAKRIDAITTADVERARNAHLETRTAATANHWLRVLKLLSMWAVKRGAIPRLPWSVAMLKVQKRPRAVLPVNLVQAWFEVIDRATARRAGAATGVRMMFALGLREGEAASARWEWIDWERKTYTPGITKGREADPIPMPDWLLAHLAPARKPAGLIAPRANGTEQPAGFARHAMHCANAACSIKGITPHRLRGTFATLMSQTLPIQTVQRLMRHKHPMTTMAYLETNFEAASQAQNRVGNIVGFNRRENGAVLQSNPTDN